MIDRLSKTGVSKSRRRRTRAGLVLLLLLVLFGSGMAAADQIRKPRYERWWEIPIAAHGGGGINGRTATNSLEAMNLAAQNGHQMIEVDFSLTGDGELVLLHGWDEDSAEGLEVAEGGLDLESFRNRKLCRKYTPMTGEDLIAWMKRHTNIYIITDTKQVSKEELYQQFHRLTELCRMDAAVLDRFVVQVYNTEMYDVIKEIYDFPNIMYATYQTEEKDIAYWNRVAEECVKRDIKAVSVSRGYVSTSRHPSLPYVGVLKDAGLLVCVHVVNTISDMERMLDAGADMVMSDYLMMEDLQYLWE